MKLCSKCKISKDLLLFNRNKSINDGFSYWCRECSHEYKKKMEATEEWAEKRRKRYKKRMSIEKNVINNRERMRKCRQTKEWKDYIKNYLHHRRKNDVEFRMRENLSGRIRVALNYKSARKIEKTISLLGCSISELKIHLQSQFTSRMNWNNYGKNGWTIDHIIPCRAFNLLNEEGQKKCFHYTNLQPLWNTDNQLKSDLMPSGDRARDLLP
jgi:hypothetical protein